MSHKQYLTISPSAAEESLNHIMATVNNITINIVIMTSIYQYRKQSRHIVAGRGHDPAALLDCNPPAPGSSVIHALCIGNGPSPIHLVPWTLMLCILKSFAVNQESNRNHVNRHTSIRDIHHTIQQVHINDLHTLQIVIHLTIMIGRYPHSSHSVK